MNRIVGIFLMLFAGFLLLITLYFWLFPKLVSVKSRFIENDGTSNELDSIEQTIILRYYGFACYCPQWTTPENGRIADSISNLEYEGDLLPDSLFYEIQSATSETPSPFETGEQDECLDFSKHIYKFTGRFYKYPQTIDYEDYPKRTRVFKYSSVECLEK